MTNETPPVCDYEGSDYQTSFWDEGGRAYEDKAEEIANYTEYVWNKNSAQDPFHIYLNRAVPE